MLAQRTSSCVTTGGAPGGRLELSACAKAWLNAVLSGSTPCNTIWASIKALASEQQCSSGKDKTY